MAMQQILEGRWNEVAGRIRTKWGEVTDDELQQVKGNWQQLVGLIQRKSGEGREFIENQIQQWISDGDTVAHRIANSAQTVAEYATESLQAGIGRVAGSVKTGYDDAERTVQQRPVESVAVAFGTGLIAGVLLSLVIRR